MLFLILLSALIFPHPDYVPYRVGSISMSPGLEKGDRVLSTKSVASERPARGDLIAFKTGDWTNFKRVIGLPNERIQMKRGVLFINDVAVLQTRVEDYRSQTGGPIAQFVERLPGGKEIRVLDEIPEGRFDNTPVYTVPAGNYFVLGDNRDNSLDSRVGDVGFVPQRNVIGKISIVY